MRDAWPRHSRCQCAGFAPKASTVAIAKLLSTLPVTISKHVNLMRRNGALARRRGRLYTIAPAFRPAPGTNVLDFGHCLVRMNPPAPQ